MGISSFAAGFLESATERIETKEKETREVNRIRAEKQLTQIMEGQKIEKKRKMEIRNNLRTISNTTGGEVLSQDQKVIIAADPDRFKRFLSFAQKDPSGMLIKQQVKDIQGGDFKNMTLGQKVELFAKQDVPEVSATIKETATAFGLPLGDLDASVKAGAASAGMTEEEFLAGVSRPTDKLPEFKEDLGLDPSETLAQMDDRLSVQLVNEFSKPKPNLELVQQINSRLGKIRATIQPKPPSSADERADLKESIKLAEKVNVKFNDFSTEVMIGDERVRVFNSELDDKAVESILFTFESAIRPTLNANLERKGVAPTANVINDLQKAGGSFLPYITLFSNPQAYIGAKLDDVDRLSVDSQNPGVVKNYLGKSQIKLQDGSTANIQLDAN